MIIYPVKTGMLSNQPNHERGRSCVRDGSGRIYIVYIDGTGDISADCRCWISYSDNKTDWTHEMISTRQGSFGSTAKMAIGPVSTVHVVWETEWLGGAHRIQHLVGSPGSWTPTWISQELGVSQNRHPACAYSYDNYLHAVWNYFRNDPYTSQLHYRKYSVGGASWDPIEVVATLGAATYYPNVEVDQNGIPHVCWNKGNYIKYSNRIGGSWSGEVNIGTTPGTAYMGGMAFDNQGNLHVGWWNSTGSAVVYRRRSAAGVWGNAWAISPGAWPSISVDAYGIICVAFGWWVPSDGYYAMWSNDNFITKFPSPPQVLQNGISVEYPNLVHTNWFDGLRHPDKGRAYMAATRLTGRTLEYYDQIEGPSFGGGNRAYLM